MASQLKYHIYKLCCSDITITDTYVGSTKNFYVRKSNHKSTCNNELGKCYNLRVYQFIRENGGWDNWDMIEIEIIYVDSKKEAERKERYWIETLKSTLNCQLPARSEVELKEKHAEYYVENREYFREIQKEYNAEHSKENVERAKQYRIDNPDCRNKKTTCECGAEVLAEGLRAHLMTDIHAERMKPDYVEPEPYDEKKYRAEQYQKNKEKLKDKNTRLIRCECMLYLTVNNKGAHLKADSHSKQMALLELGESNTTHTLCECGVFVLITNSGMKNHLKTKKHTQIMEKLATDFMA